MMLYIKEKLTEAGIEYKAIRFYDSEFNADLEGILTEGQEFLEQMEEKYPGKREGILVKCAAGISRSPTMLINYLCYSRRLSYVEALNYVRDKEKDYVDFGASPYYIFADHLKKKYKDSYE